MPQKNSQTTLVDTFRPHPNVAQVEELLIAGTRNFAGIDLHGLPLNKVSMNYFGVNFSGANLVQTDLSGKTFTKTSFAGADCSSANFMGVIFSDNVILDEVIIHGTALFGATAKEYGNELNIIEQTLARCIVSSSQQLPHIHFSSLDQTTKRWILFSKADPNETFRTLMNEYLKENSGFRTFFSAAGRYKAVVALYMQTRGASGTLPDFIEYLGTNRVTIDHINPIYKRLEFVNDWYDLNQDKLLNQLLPPVTPQGINAKSAQPPSMPSLVKMVACEISQLIANKIKNLFMPELDEEN